MKKKFSRGPITSKTALSSIFCILRLRWRDFEQIPKAVAQKVPKREIDLAENLMDKMSAAEFEPENYQDEYRARFLAMVDQKVEGQEIAV